MKPPDSRTARLHDIRRSYLGRECDDCRIPVDPKSRRCTLCNKHYPLTKFDFDKDRCEHCGSYEVWMNEMMEWYCEDCARWIDSTNEGNGVTFGDCRECGGGFMKDASEYEDVCYWCS